MDTNQTVILSFSEPGPKGWGLGLETLGLMLSGALEVLAQARAPKAWTAFAGVFLEYLAQENSALLSRIIELADAGRIELLASPFYVASARLAVEEDWCDLFRLSDAFWLPYNIKSRQTAWIWPQCVSRSIVDAARSLGLQELLSASDTEPSTGLGIICAVSMRQDADDLVCENMPHLPVCLISGERLSETVFCAGAAQELFRQRLASWKCCPEEDAARASVPALSAHEYCSGAARLAERAAEMRGILAPLPGYIAERPHFFENKQRLAQASKHFLSALEGRFFHRQHDPAFLRQRFLRDGYGALLEAQVAVDKIWRPETDPVDGWVDLAAVPRADGGEETVVDNPFQRLYFAHSLGGALVEYDYKPRKLNLLNCEARTANSVPAFCGKLLTREAGGGFTQLGGEFSFSSVRLIRKSPDLLKVRFVEKLEAGASGARREWTGSLYKDFTVRAGLGAHQANATTGFSLEYWLESDVPAAADMFVGVEWTMMLPSGDPRVMSARPLLCVGGESERVLALTQSWLLDSAFHPGGLYGVRLIDGLEGLVIDLRASHRLDFIELAPLWSEGRSAVDSELEQSMCFGGTRVRFIAPLSAFAGDYRSNTIFVSIY